jgi:hypothetical protein
LDKDDESSTFSPHSLYSRSAPRPARALETRAPRKSTLAKPPASKSHPQKAHVAAPYYKVDPCNCCNGTTCSMMCFYTFSHGNHKGQTYRQLFESACILDK